MYQCSGSPQANISIDLIQLCYRLADTISESSQRASKEVVTQFYWARRQLSNSTKPYLKLANTKTNLSSFNTVASNFNRPVPNNLDWICDVLADLANCAEENGLPDSEDAIRGALTAARAELHEARCAGKR